MGEDDRVLVERIQAGDGDGGAFRELISRYHGKVYRLAFRVTRDPEKAQDVLQETFLTVYRKIGAFRFESAFSSWLYRVAYNTALMKLRKDRSEPEEVPLDTLTEPMEAEGRVVDLAERADELLVRREALEQVREAVDRLPEMYRTVFILRDVEELSTEEVATLLDTTTATVKMRLHRARLHLRQALSREPR